MNRNRMRCGNVFRFLRHDAVPLHREISERQRSDSCDTSCRITFPAEIPVHRCRKRTVPLCRISASGRSGKRSSRHHDSPGIEIVRILLQSLCRFQDISGAGNSRIVRRLVSVAGNIRRQLNRPYGSTGRRLPFGGSEYLVRNRIASRDAVCRSEISGTRICRYRVRPVFGAAGGAGRERCKRKAFQSVWIFPFHVVPKVGLVLKAESH